MKGKERREQKEKEQGQAFLLPLQEKEEPQLRIFMIAVKYEIHSENSGKANFKTYLPIRKLLESCFTLFC